MNQVHRARPLLGTIVQISVASPLPPARLHAAVDAAFAQISLVHRLMSWHDPGSDLSRLNRQAATSRQSLHAHTRAVLAAALHFARLSEGAFDPCIAGTLTRRGLLPYPVDAPPLPECPDRAASWRDIELCGQGIRFHRPLWVDLGGIAKGYAVDLALEHLVGLNIPDVVVNAGGDLRVSGPQAHSVAIRHPRSAHAVAHELSIHCGALATSSAFGSQRRSTAGPENALLDPRTGESYAAADSVSVLASSCMTADALTKIALFAAPGVARTAFEACEARCIRLAPIH
ncbi:MAG TPA: FAD:protein FMN transferase [Steroidobacteraceae bacterium]|nr:FAD:protein FMN transferase [Steroidobacteraceae bacterium]